MFRLLVLTVTLAVALAWDPSLKIAEKIAIPHHIRHGYDYPYINIAQMMDRNVRQGFSQPLPVRPVSQGFSQPLSDRPQGFSQPLSDRPLSQGFSQPLSDRPLSQGFGQSVAPSRGFQGGFPSQPFESTQFRNAPAQQTRFFRLGASARSSPSFNGRLS